jgi:hypothetical protein
MALVAGMVFTVLGATFAVAALADLEVEPRLVWPVMLIGTGIAVLLGSRPTDR